MQPNYSKTSQDVYGKPNEPIQLFDSGDFYDSIGVKFTDDLIVSADTIKQADFGQIDLARIYDEGEGKIIGINNIQKQEVRRIISQEVNKELRKVLDSL